MKRFRNIIIGVCLAVAAASPVASGQQDRVCWRTEGHLRTRTLKGYTLQIAPARVTDVGQQSTYEGWLCQALVLAPDGTIVFRAVDADIVFNAATGKDINGDGQPDAVFEAYSGGAHCCWTYWVVPLGNPLEKALAIQNEQGVGFTDLDGDGRPEIVTADGAFDYFDGFSHASTVFPLVVLRLKGTKLLDVSSEFWSEYEKEITEARKHLTEGMLRQFRTTRLGLTLECDDLQGERLRNECSVNWQVKALVLTVVLAELYGGREEEAWKTLDEMWPPTDKARIRNLILQTRARGILSYVGHSCR